jgi:hypothetical protein
MAHHDDMEKLERALTESHRSQSDDLPFSTIDVTQNVMRDLRRSSGERSWWAPSVVLDQLVWRTATITAAVVLMVTVLTVGLFRPQTGENPGLLAEEFESVPLFGD